MKVTIRIEGKPTELDIKFVNGWIEAFNRGERVYLSFLQEAEVRMKIDKQIMKDHAVENFKKALSEVR